MATSSPSSPEVSTSEAQPVFSYKTATQEEVLEDLSSRFILNLPDEEFDSLERLCFQVEQAHWFYEDFIREQNTKLPSLPLKKFSEMLFRACPLLHHWSDDHERAFNQFMQYKTRVPVCGAIMLNDAMDKCVLVKGWKASSGWGFPKGKINETEPPPACAIREVHEETGYNLAGQLDPKNVIELSIKEQKISLFIVPGVPEDYPFETKTRKEISKIEWFKVADLPTWKKNKTATGRFYLISPFISPLKSFINQRKPRNQRKGAKSKKIHDNVPEIPLNDYTLQESEAEQELTANHGDRTPRPSAVEVPGETDISNMDPQLARLLSSLSLSANTSGKVNASERQPNGKVNASERQPNGKVNASERQPNGISDRQHTQIPTENIAHPHPLISNDSDFEPSRSDWSSSVPPAFEESPHVSPEQTIPPEPREGTGSLSVSPSAIPLVSHYKSSNGVNINELMASSVPPAALPSPTSSLRSPHVHSPTADISPYLSRAVEVPKSAKELQARSLLESVAIESEKMAHVMSATTAISNPGAVPISYLRPGPPPQMIHDNSADLAILYSSQDGGRNLASVNGFRPGPHMGDIGQGFQDLQARSRTSHALHRNPMHNVTGSVNFNQNQQNLLAALNGPRSPPVNTQHHMGPPRFAPQQLPPHPQMYNSGAPYYPPLNNTQFVALPPPVNFPYGTGLQPNGRAVPLPQNSVRPFTGVHGMHMPGVVPNVPSDNAQQAAATLLTILNGPRQPITVPGPVPQY